MSSSTPVTSSSLFSAAGTASFVDANGKSVPLGKITVSKSGRVTIPALTFGKKNEEIFLGREIQSHRDFSEVTARMIDEEVVRIVRKAQSTAEKTLQDNSGLLENIANALLKFETIEGKEVETIMAGKTIKRLKNGSIKKPKSKSSKNTSKNNKQT